MAGCERRGARAAIRLPPRGLASRWIVRCTLAFAAIAGARVAAADPTPTPTTADVIGDQSIGAELGVATGGRVTPGGFRLAGHYLYQLSEQDWFDGGAAFTFGSGGAACFRDRTGSLVCDHGLTDGDGVEISATVRRYFEPKGMFRPFARAGIGVGLARFGGDSVSGFIIPVHAGGGLRADVSEAIAIVAQVELAFGLGE